MSQKNQNFTFERKMSKEKNFESINEENSYYRTKYKKYKEKFKAYLNSHQKLRDDFSQLTTKYENLNDELNSEKILRKKFEIKVIELMKFDQKRDMKKFSNCNKEENMTLDNFEKIEKNLMKPTSTKIDFFSKTSNDNTYRINIDKLEKTGSNQEDLLNRDSTSANEFFRNSSINKETDKDRDKYIDLMESNMGNGVNNLNLARHRSDSNSVSGSSSFKSPTTLHMQIPDSSLNSTNLKERNLKEITEKFDTEKMKKSLTIDFIEYEKDSLPIRRKIVTREDKIKRLEKILKIWVELCENIKKSVDNFTYNLSMFNENFIKEPLDIFEECPDLISLIYILQSVVSDISSQHKIFSATLENSFISQIKNFINQSIADLKENKQALSKHTDDFNLLSTKFLSTKKSNIKDTMKDNYFSQFKLLEFTRYDFLNKINKCLLFTRVDLPEKICLLIWAFLCLFKQGNEILIKVEQNVSANLEKISVKHREKEKIIEEIKSNKKELIKNFENVNASMTIKEGFLNVKPKDTNEYFKKRYFKIHLGKLIYFKLKKGTDQIDISNTFQLCDLLFTNVKKNEKDYEYPFIFELISANNKKCFLLQGDTDKEVEEWISAIRNSIANSISQYNTTSVVGNSENPNANKDHLNMKQDNISNTQVDMAFFLNSQNTESFRNYNNNNSDYFPNTSENLIDRLIQTNKCTDCDGENPTWCSINWLCLICIDCSGVHRSLGVQISKIRSLRLDNLDSDILELIDIMKIDRINKILEANVKSYEKPKSNSLYKEKESFIVNKYQLKKFMRVPPVENKFRADVYSGDKQVKETSYAHCVFKFIDLDDLISVYHFIKLELCDVNKYYECEKEKYSFVHHSAKKGKINCFKLLFLLGGDIQSHDSKNLKPIDYATIFKNSEIVEYILKKLDEVK